MTSEEIHTEYLNQVQDLFNEAIKELETTFNQKKENYKNCLSDLKDVLKELPLKRKFMNKYFPANTIITDSEGYIKYINPKLDIYIFKLYLNLYKKPDELIQNLQNQ